MMYESPIELMVTNIHNETTKKQDAYILRYVQQIGINVDKGELLKALRYDREQYVKGFEDGIKGFAERLKDELADWVGADKCISYSRIEKVLDNVLKEMIGE